MRAIVEFLVLITGPFIHAANLPQRPSLPQPVLSSNDNETTLSNPNLNNSLLLPNTQVRKLVAHRCLIYIVRLPTVPLPDPQYKQAISTALENTALLKDRLGDLAIVARPLHVLEGSVVFTADNLGRSPRNSLTIGMVEEALRVLQEYFPRYPYESMVWVSRGLDEEHPRLAVGNLALFIRSDPYIPSSSDARIS